MLAFVSLLLSSAIIFSICVAKNALDGNPVYKHAIVATADHNNLHVTVYKWDAAKLKGTGMVKIMSKCHREGGFEAYIREPDLAAEHLTQCLNTDVINSAVSDKSTTLLYYRASSAMSLLKENVSIVLDNVMLAMTNTPYSLDAQNISILTPEDEAIFIWISANYLLGHISQHSDTKAVLKQDSINSQYVYKAQSSSAGYQPVKLFGRYHFLHSVFDQCYGWRELLLKKQALLLKMHHGSISVKSAHQVDIVDPCWPVGANSTIAASSLLSPYCDDGLVYSNNTNLDMINITFHGTSNIFQCLAVMTVIIKKLQDSGISPSRTEHSTLGLPMFTDVVTKLRESHSLGKMFTLTEFNESIYTECSKPFKMQEKLCFSGLYLYAYVTSRLEFTEDMWNNMQFDNVIQHEKVDWSLGFILMRTNNIPVILPVVHIGTGLFMLVSFLSIIIMIFSIGFACKARSIRPQVLSVQDTTKQNYKTLKS